MDEQKFAFVLHKGSATARVEISADGLSADDVETLISRLAELRAHMTPSVARVPERDDVRHNIIAPSIVVTAGTTPPGVDIFVEHPGIGWIAMRFPAAQPLIDVIAKAVPPGTKGPVAH